MSAEDKRKSTEIVLSATCAFLIGLSFIIMFFMSSPAIKVFGSDGIEWCFHSAVLCILLGIWVGAFTIIGRACVSPCILKEAIWFVSAAPIILLSPILWDLSIILGLIWIGYSIFLLVIIWLSFNDVRRPKPSPFEKFYMAQDGFYEEALAEIRNGRKESHWMWFIFPQLEGLGQSYMSQHYALHSMQETRDYLADPILGKRLVEISNELVRLPGDNIFDVLDYPDNLKLQSCMTLFMFAGSEYSVFQEVLDKYFCGECDWNTIKLLGISSDQAIKNWEAKKL